MKQVPREEMRAVLRRFGVEHARRATTTDASEEVVLLTDADLARVDATALTLALMEVLPHTKVWVVADHPRWSSEPV